MVLLRTIATVIILSMILLGSSITALYLYVQKHDLPLGFAESWLESFMSSDDQRVDLDEPILTSGTYGHGGIRLHVKRITLYQAADNKPLYQFDNLNMAISVKYLLRGQLRPRYLWLDSCKITTEPTNPNTDSELSWPPPQTLSEIMGPLYNKDGIARFLTGADLGHIKIELPSLNKDIPPSQLVLHHITFTNQPHSNQIILNIDGNFKTSQAIPDIPISLRAEYNIKTQQLKGNLAVSQLPSQLWQTLGITELQDFDAESWLAFVINDNWNLEFARLHAELQLLPDRKSPFQAGKLLAEYDYEQKTLFLKEGRLKTSDGDIVISGRLNNIDTLTPQHALPFHLIAGVHNSSGYDFWEDPITATSLLLAGDVQITDYQSLVWHLNIPSIDLDSDDLHVSGQMQLDNNPERLYLNSQLSLQALSVKQLLKAWPIALPGSARTWIKNNLLAGHFSDSKFSASYCHAHKTTGCVLTKDKTEQAAPTKLNWQGDIKISQAEIHYMTDMQPIKNAYGHLTFRNSQMALLLEQGQINKLNIAGTKFIIPDILDDVPEGKLSMPFTGKARNLLDVLDSPALSLISNNGLPKNQMRGKIRKGHLNITMPLIRDLKLSQIDLQTKVNVQGFSMPLVEDLYKLTKANLTINSDLKSLKIQGIGRVNGVQFKNIALRQSLIHKAPTNIHAKGQLTITDLKKLHIDLSYYMRGTMPLSFNMQLSNNRITRFDAKSNMQDVWLSIPGSVWMIPAGDPKKMTLQGQQRKNGDIILDKVTLKAPHSQLSLKKVRITEHGIRDMIVKQAKLQDFADISGKYRFNHKQQKHYFRGQAKYINLEPFLFVPKQGQYKIINGKQITNKRHPFPRLDLDIDVGNFMTSSGWVFSDVTLDLRDVKNNPYAMQGNVIFKKSGKSGFFFEKQKDMTTKFSLTTQKAGDLLQELGLYDNLKGGRLVVEGQTLPLDAEKRSGLQGKAELEGGVLYQAPVMARLISLASLDAIVDILSGDGLSLDLVQATFHQQHNTFRFNDGLLRGSSLGLTFAGQRNFVTGAINMEGSMVPLYGLNSFVGQIPLLSEILTDDKGGGIFAMQYSVTGSLTKPDISVSPISVLLPGILRRLLF